MRIFFISIIAFFYLSPAFGQTKQELYRPEFHFSPQKNWLNDPNGLVYFADEYHLFYQYNPYGSEWGNMSWGHAKSKDLVQWDHLPIAIPVENGIMAFSGSVVVDSNNTSGFGFNGRPPLVAIYTGAGTYQDQRIAFSTDSGLTWTTYEDNPVINLYNNNFRDPKVLWHEGSQKWIMVVSLGEYKKIRFYSSSDLKNWNFLQDFGPEGNISGAWECPDLFPLNIDENPLETKWVLVHSVAPGSAQYFIGHFDGQLFTWDETEINGELIEDFESEDYGDWTVQGNAFGTEPTKGTLPNQQPVTGYLGQRLVNSFLGGDSSIGRIISPEFTIQKKYISFLIGGGNHPNGTYIKLIVQNKTIATSTGQNNELLIWNNWDVQNYVGQEAHIEIVDSVTGGWGHLNIDHIIQTDNPIEKVNYGSVDYGKDFYALQSFSGMPDGRRVWLAWMNNWGYAGEVPTNPWKGIMSIPREVKLSRINGQVRLVQTPVSELKSIEKEILSLQNEMSGTVSEAIQNIRLKTFKISSVFDASGAESFLLKFRKGNDQYTEILFDMDNHEIRFDRSKSGALAGNQFFRDVQVAPLKIQDGKVHFELIVDNCSAELFHAGGQVVMSNQIFPDSTSIGFELIANTEMLLVENFTVWELESKNDVTFSNRNIEKRISRLKIYPNPLSKGNITLALEDASYNNAKIKIFNLQGKRIFEMPMNTGKLEIPANYFPTNGIYIVFAEIKNEYYVDKIVVSR